jgi:hypothetical protein
VERRIDGLNGLMGGGDDILLGTLKEGMMLEVSNEERFFEALNEGRLLEA